VSQRAVLGSTDRMMSVTFSSWFCTTPSDEDRRGASAPPVVRPYRGACMATSQERCEPILVPPLSTAGRRSHR
jgi:hypothetical protein